MPDLYVLTQTTDAVPLPVESALVKLYDAVNVTHLASDTTNAVGLASFIGLSAGTYYVRMKGPSSPYQFSGGATQQVVLAAADVRATIEMEPFTAPVATHPNYCRCWGYFTEINGDPAANVALYFAPIRDDEVLMALLYTTGVTTRSTGVASSKAIEVVLDSDGYGMIDLPRGSTLLATIPRFQDTPLEIEIPDAASANLVDILFPYPAMVKFYSGGVEVNSALLTIGDSTTLDVIVTLRSGVEPADTTAFFSIDDEVGAEFQHSDGSVVITGTAAGTYTLSATAAAPAGFILPEPAIAVNLTVEVA